MLLLLIKNNYQQKLLTFSQNTHASITNFGSLVVLVFDRSLVTRASATEHFATGSTVMLPDDEAEDGVTQHAHGDPLRGHPGHSHVTQLCYRPSSDPLSFLTGFFT